MRSGKQDNGHDSVKNQKRALVCYNCGGKGHPARLCPTPSDRAAHAVDEKVTLRRNRPTKVMCVELSRNANSMVQVTKMMTSWEWDVSPQNKASGSASQPVVDSGAAENVLPAGVLQSCQTQCNSQGLMRALDFVEPAERESAITVKGSSMFE